MSENDSRPERAQPLPYTVRCRVPDGRENEWGYETWEAADRQRRSIAEMFRSAGEAVVITVFTPYNPLRYEVEADPSRTGVTLPHLGLGPPASGPGCSCPEGGRHALPEGVRNMITGDDGEVAEALAAAYDGCEPCEAGLERRVAEGDGHLVLLMTAFWLCSQAQVRASQELPPAACADGLFPPAVLDELAPGNRRLLRGLVLEPAGAPGGRAAARPGTHELAALVHRLDDGERTALWHDALDGATGIVLMEAFRP